jgi:hypothetical protein
MDNAFRHSPMALDSKGSFSKEKNVAKVYIFNYIKIFHKLLFLLL